MIFGYNTNGFAHHRLEDAIDIISLLGYQSVAITLDFHALHPSHEGFSEQVTRVKNLLSAKNLRSVIETGGRFVLDLQRKHQPTLISPVECERQVRLEFLMKAVDIARELDSNLVSFWSGRPLDKASSGVLMDRLVYGCHKLCDYAAERKVRLAFEPEPGMFIDTMEQFAELHQRVNQPNFGLTIDIGHLHCQGEVPISDQLRKWSQLLWNVHIEDMSRGVHEHLMFGEGEIDFLPILRTLTEIGYEGGVHAELSRHSHDAVNAAWKSLDFLRAAASEM